MKYLVLFTTFFLLSACGLFEPDAEVSEMPCPENWRTLEENEKDFQFQRINKLAKALHGTEEEMNYESFFFFKWKYCSLCCQFGCPPDNHIRNIQFLAYEKDTSYFLKTTASSFPSCNYVTLSTSERLEKER